MKKLIPTFEEFLNEKKFSIDDFREMHKGEQGNHLQDVLKKILKTEVGFMDAMKDGFYFFVDIDLDKAVKLAKKAGFDADHGKYENEDALVIVPSNGLPDSMFK